MTINLSPFGMQTCCICDADTTHAIPDGEELLPYCACCAKSVKREFPSVKVMLYTPRPA